MTDLTIHEFLTAVAQYGVGAREELIERGHLPSVVMAKAQKAARLGYTEYGVVVDRPWLTDKGKQRLDTP